MLNSLCTIFGLVGGWLVDWLVDKYVYHRRWNHQAVVDHLLKLPNPVEQQRNGEKPGFIRPPSSMSRLLNQANRLVISYTFCTGCPVKTSNTRTQRVGKRDLEMVTCMTWEYPKTKIIGVCIKVFCCKSVPTHVHIWYLPIHIYHYICMTYMYAMYVCVHCCFISCSVCVRASHLQGDPPPMVHNCWWVHDWKCTKESDAPQFRAISPSHHLFLYLVLAVLFWHSWSIHIPFRCLGDVLLHAPEYDVI